MIDSALGKGLRILEAVATADLGLVSEELELARMLVNAQRAPFNAASSPIHRKPFPIDGRDWCVRPGTSGPRG